MKVLVLGASGMVGSAFFQEMTRRKWDVWAGLRKSSGDYEAYFQKAQVVENLNATKWELIENALKQLKPDVVVNAAGVTLRKPEIKDLDFSLKVNSQLPQMLKFWCQRENSYLVHMSTDCVFSGTTEAEYDERSIPDALDIYGRTKALGEVFGSNCVTLRGSMIGREWFGKTELLEWAIAQKGLKISGYSRVQYSGITTLAMARFVCDLLGRGERPTGLYQVSGPEISKYELLKLVNERFQLGLQIEENTEKTSRKVLSCQLAQKDLGYQRPEWEQMLAELD